MEVGLARRDPIAYGRVREEDNDRKNGSAADWREPRFPSFVDRRQRLLASVASTRVIAITKIESARQLRGQMLTTTENRSWHQQAGVS